MALEHGEPEWGVVDGVDAIAAGGCEIDAHAGHNDSDRFALLRRCQPNVDDTAFQIEDLGSEVELAESAHAAGAEPERVRADANFRASVVGRESGADCDDVIQLGTVPPAVTVFLGTPDADVAVDRCHTAGNQRRRVVGIARRCARLGGGKRGAAADGQHGCQQAEPASQGNCRRLRMVKTSR